MNGGPGSPEQFQKKCEAVFRSELRQQEKAVPAFHPKNLAVRLHRPAG